MPSARLVFVGLGALAIVAWLAQRPTPPPPLCSSLAWAYCDTVGPAWRCYRSDPAAADDHGTICR